MTLPKKDLEFLARRGYNWRIVPAGAEWLLIIDSFSVAGGGFSPPVISLMVRLPAGYPLAALDMWYCDPPVQRNGSYPPSADAFEEHGGRRWQRFSRHFNDTWSPGVDGLRSFFRFIEEELQGRGADAPHAHAQ